MRSFPFDLVIETGTLPTEPLAELSGQLARLSSQDDLWMVIHSAVGLLSGTATVHVAANDGASSSLLPMLDLHAPAAPNARYVVVNATTLVGLEKGLDSGRRHLR